MTWPGVGPSGEFYVSTNDEFLFDFQQAQGDVVGTADSLTVSGIAGIPIQDGSPSQDQVLKYNGSVWAFQPDISGIASHSLLGPYHSDTTTSSPTRGGLVYGSGAGATWNQLPLGTAEYVLYSDGTDVGYTRLGPNTPFELGTAGAPSITFTGDLDTGWSAQNANELIGSASGVSLLTLDGNDGTLTLNGGQIVKTKTYGANGGMGPDDYVALATAAGITISLTASPTAGQVVVVKDRDGNAAFGPNAIVISGNGNNIDGNATIRIRRAYGSFTLLYNGSTWNVI